ncbi:MAG: hypothetical protein KGJ65_13620 [Betaproteobacteria bacterium]|nr:hypothetical protein [Betaproteobacteria bacterium]MDE2124687.1 hypothetical protein [Betaproteobacteria bacterium]
MWNPFPNLQANAASSLGPSLWVDEAFKKSNAELCILACYGMLVNSHAHLLLMQQAEALEFDRNSELKLTTIRLRAPI